MPPLRKAAQWVCQVVQVQAQGPVVAGPAVVRVLLWLARGPQARGRAARQVVYQVVRADPALAPAQALAQARGAATPCPCAPACLPG